MGFDRRARLVEQPLGSIGITKRSQQVEGAPPVMQLTKLSNDPTPQFDRSSDRHSLGYCCHAALAGSEPLLER